MRNLETLCGYYEMPVTIAVRIAIAVVTIMVRVMIVVVMMTMLIAFVTMTVPMTFRSGFLLRRPSLDVNVGNVIPRMAVP